MPKDKSNFCDLFEVRLTGRAGQAGWEAKDSRKKRFDNLFEE